MTATRLALLLLAAAACLTPSLASFMGADTPKPGAPSPKSAEALISKGQKPIKYDVTNEITFEIRINVSATVNDTRNFTMALFGDIVPMTVKNIIAICGGFEWRGEKLNYSETPVHRIITDFVVQTGDIILGDGTGGRSIYGDYFVDENFILSHRSAGWVSMANHGADTNGSQFVIMLGPARWLDEKHVVFAKVVRGMSWVRTINAMPTDDEAWPLNDIVIQNCYVENTPRYTLPDSALDTDADYKP